MARYTTFNVASGGTETPCIEFGGGNRTLVILPGMSLHPLLPTAGSIAKRYRCFSEDGYRVVVVDRVVGDMAGRTVEDMAEDASAVLDRLAIEHACVFGASQGGMIALVLAARYPRLTRAIALGSSACRLLPKSARLMEEWARLADEGDVATLNRGIFSHVYSDGFLTRYANALKVLETQGAPDELARYANLARASAGFDFTGELGAVACPVFVVGAGGDRVLFGESSLELARLLGCELYVYPDASHAAYDECPDYQQRLKAFFDRVYSGEKG